jgi:hypothetical protein
VNARKDGQGEIVIYQLVLEFQVMKRIGFAQDMENVTKWINVIVNPNGKEKYVIFQYAMDLMHLMKLCVQEMVSVNNLIVVLVKVDGLEMNVKSQFVGELKMEVEMNVRVMVHVLLQILVIVIVDGEV